MSEDTKKKEDDDLISSAIGDYGKWQLYLTFALSLVNIPCTWHIFVPTFHAASQETWCARPKTYEDVPPELWKNCTGQTSGDGYCSMFDVISRNLSESDLCKNSSDYERINCTSWEFDGEGKFDVEVIIF